MMNISRKLRAAIGFFLASFLAINSQGALASPIAPQSGVDYITLSEVQPTDTLDKKVEVIEFFSYACPHCNAFEPVLAEWLKKQEGVVVFKRVPIAFRAQWVPLQKMYYTLEALGKVNELHTKVFSAIHRDRLPFDSDVAMVDLAVKLGVDRKQFTDTYHSFGVQSRLRRVAQIQENYKVAGVPMIAIDGRYETSPGVLADGGLKQSEAQLYLSSLQVVDFLVAKSSKR